MDNQLRQQPRALLNPIEAMFSSFTTAQRRAWLVAHRKERLKLPKRMTPQADLPDDIRAQILGSWKSQDYACIAWPSAHPVVLARLSINRMDIDPKTGSWMPGINWDTLYRIKNECGYAANDAVEVFPAEDKLVNVSNMRHLWVLNFRLDFGL